MSAQYVLPVAVNARGFIPGPFLREQNKVQFLKLEAPMHLCTPADYKVNSLHLIVDVPKTTMI